MKKFNLDNGRILAMASAVLLIIASFLPWSKISLLGISRTVTGIQGDGKIQVGIAVVVLALLAIPKIKIWIPMILTGIAGLVALLDFNSIASANRKLDGMSEFAFGFFLVPLAVAGIFAGCIWAMMKSRQAESSATPLVPNLQSEVIPN